LTGRAGSAGSTTDQRSGDGQHDHAGAGGNQIAPHGGLERCGIGDAVGRQLARLSGGDVALVDARGPGLAIE